MSNDHHVVTIVAVEEMTVAAAVVTVETVNREGINALLLNIILALTEKSGLFCAF